MRGATSAADARAKREAGECRLLCEPAARRLAEAHAGHSATPKVLRRWHRHGATLTHAEVGALLFAAPQPAPA